ncbi:LysR family transcriptional regulator [Actinokineospora auranticolor]|uniref:DNA-binding transcriptional LysR family regulator n=1 Tax=Actinokineospora auranticolor TaxID=155976 RepID=A0A2S6GS34_9PSEU|nr:LysR family transcriptional regulator [Actinokineospora auranticolor]PPK68065.1 DNA-binding transcriptional LysR family regulator [Actinokineospora auranticolor]
MIDPRRLRVLRALADHGTVTAAGAALHLTPSAVSQQLAALESEVGQELLRRRGRRVWLTSAGELLVEHADAVLAELDRAEARLAAYGAGELGQVRVAAFASAITQVVAPAITALRALAPSVTILVRDAEGQQSLPMLLDGEIDIAVSMHNPLDGPEHRATFDSLYSEPFNAVLPPGHPLLAHPEIPLPALADDDWVVPLPGNPCRDVLLTACAQAGFTPRVTHTTDDFTATAALVAAGVGVALIPRTTLTSTDRVRPVTPSPQRQVYAAVRRGRETHPLIQVVRKALIEASPA